MIEEIDDSEQKLGQQPQQALSLDEATRQEQLAHARYELEHKSCSSCLVVGVLTCTGLTGYFGYLACTLRRVLARACINKSMDYGTRNKRKLFTGPWNQ